MPDIDVVVTCFDYGRFLEEAVRSVRAQTFRDHRLVVVDDGSTEPETLAAVERVERSGVEVLRQENRGVAAARNVGIASGRGRYVVCLDGDDRLHPEFLEKTKRVLDADETGRVGFVAPWVRKFGRENEIWRSSPFDPVLIGYRCCVPVTSLFRRRAWDEVGGYLEELELAEDWSFWIAIVAAGYRWEVLEEPLFDYRKHGRSKSDSTDAERPRVFESLLRANPDYYARHHEELLLVLYSRFRELDDVWHEKAVAMGENEVLLERLRDAEEDGEAARGEARRAHASYGVLEEEHRKLEASYRALEVDRRELAAEAARRSEALEESRRHLANCGAHDVERLWQEREALYRAFERLETDYRKLERYAQSLEEALDERPVAAVGQGVEREGGR